MKVPCRGPLQSTAGSPRFIPSLRSPQLSALDVGLRRHEEAVSETPAAGIALAEFEITQAEALRHFALFGALVAAAGLWLIDEFAWPVWRH